MKGQPVGEGLGTHRGSSELAAGNMMLADLPPPWRTALSVYNAGGEIQNNCLLAQCGDDLIARPGRHGSLKSHSRFTLLSARRTTANQLQKMQRAGRVFARAKPQSAARQGTQACDIIHFLTPTGFRRRCTASCLLKVVAGLRHGLSGRMSLRSALSGDRQFGASGAEKPPPAKRVTSR